MQAVLPWKGPPESDICYTSVVASGGSLGPCWSRVLSDLWTYMVSFHLFRLVRFSLLYNSAYLYGYDTNAKSLHFTRNEI